MVLYIQLDLRVCPHTHAHSHVCALASTHISSCATRHLCKCHTQPPCPGRSSMSSLCSSTNLMASPRSTKPCPSPHVLSCIGARTNASHPHSTYYNILVIGDILATIPSYYNIFVITQSIQTRTCRARSGRRAMLTAGPRVPLVSSRHRSPLCRAGTDRQRAGEW